MGLVITFLILAAVILGYLYFTKKTKQNSVMVNFLLTTIATLIGVIMAINLSVNNEVNKEKQDLIKILETGISVINRVSSYIDTEKLAYSKNVTNDSLGLKALDTLKKVSDDFKLNSIDLVANGVANSKQIEIVLGTTKKKLDSLKKVLNITDLDADKDSKLSTSLIISNKEAKVPFPDFITTILSDSSVLKNLSQPTLDRLSQDYINLTRSYDVYSTEADNLNIYLLTLEGIQRALYLEINYQKDNLDLEELQNKFLLLDEYLKSKLVYQTLKEKVTL
jgi:hypothetical protein